MKRKNKKQYIDNSPPIYHSYDYSKSEFNDIEVGSVVVLSYDIDGIGIKGYEGEVLEKGNIHLRVKFGSRIVYVYTGEISLKRDGAEIV
jgi:hypothetical protein